MSVSVTTVKMALRNEPLTGLTFLLVSVPSGRPDMAKGERIGYVRDRETGMPKMFFTIFTPVNYINTTRKLHNIWPDNSPAWGKIENRPIWKFNY